MFNLYTQQGLVARPDVDTAITVGVFDGVHRGHCDLIRQLSTGHQGLQPLVVTLTSHPAYVLGRRQSELWLDEPEEHRQLLFEAGARYVAELPFTPEVSHLSACAMASELFGRLRMRHLLIGYDSRFGSRTNDDFDRLPQQGQQQGFTVAAGERYLYNGVTVSSSAIRHALQQGEVHVATDLLGHPYTLRGIVQHGRGVGHTIGFPTANIDLSACRKMLPKAGVYAARLNGHPAMANFGSAPTYGIERPMLEVHLIGYEGNLYEQHVEVQLVHRLRGVERFPSPEVLQQQLQHDLIQAQQWL